MVHWFWDEVWIRPGVAFFIVYLFIYWVYQIIIAVRGAWSPPPLPHAKNFRRFAVLIPAHNEERVIGNLLESLLKQTYPKNYFDIYVSCDNCQDETAKIAKSYNVKVLEKHDNAHLGKTGNVQWALREIPLEKYDAVAMFDADNLAEKNFLTKMNDYMESHSKAQAIQGYLDTKNPDDTWISRSYALSYWYTNRFWQLARSNWGLSAALGGTGLVVTVSCLKTIGWELKSLTEDLEFSTRIILSGSRVHWNNEAIIFDEKPLTFWASRRQRTRWMQGHYWVLMKYGPRLLLQWFKTWKIQYLDWLFYLLSAVTTVIGFTVLAVRIAIGSSWNFGISIWPLWLASGLIQCAFNVIMGPSFYWGKFTLRYVPDILSYFLYGLTWPPIMFYAAFLSRNQNQWVKTVHTRDIGVSDVRAKEKTLDII